METKKINQSVAEKKLYSAVDEYVQAILNCKNVERKINYLINLAGLCYDYHYVGYAKKIYVKALEICLENETGDFPRFKHKAIMLAKSIQFVKGDTQYQLEMQINAFYKKYFPSF
jgi:hypothetical protein